MADMAPGALSVLEALRLRPAVWVLSSADPALTTSKPFMLAAVRIDGHALKHACGALRADPDVVRAAVAQTPFSLEHVDRCRMCPQAYRAAVLAAVPRLPRALMHAGRELRTDGAFMAAAVALSGHALVYASPELRADRGLALAAVRQHGGALEHVGAALQDDVAVVLLAVAQDPAALRHASTALRNDAGVVLAALAAASRGGGGGSGSVLEHAGEVPRMDRECVLAACTQDGRSLRYANPALRGDRACVLAALAVAGNVPLEGIAEPVGRYRILVSTTPLLSLVPRQLQADPEVQRLTAAMADPDRCACVRAELRSAARTRVAGASAAAAAAAGASEALAAVEATPRLRLRFWHPTRHRWCAPHQHTCVLAVLLAEVRVDAAQEAAQALAARGRHSGEASAVGTGDGVAGAVRVLLPSLPHDVWLLALQFVAWGSLGGIPVREGL